MLPPHSPESPVPGAALAEFGATATHPSMGLSGTEYRVRCSAGFSGVATPRCASRCQRTVLPPSFIFTARSLSRPRSTTASSLTAQSRFRRSRVICTARVSPGAAVST